MSKLYINYIIYIINMNICDAYNDFINMLFETLNKYGEFSGM
jgi:hypothetical protein